jgi:hypothetical protein
MGNTTVKFTAKTETDDFIFELQGEKSVFTKGDRAVLNVYPAGINQVRMSAGTHSFRQKNLVKNITEYLIFASADRAQLSYPLKKLLSANWIGRINGAPSAKGRTVSLPAVSSGVLFVSYETDCDVLELVCPLTGHCLIEVFSNGGYGYTSLDYTYGSGDGTVETILHVRDACTNVLLSDAHVWVNGGYRGKTDSGGYINLGMLSPGKYQLLTKKEGYQDSDGDIIANDSFIVE